MFIVGLVSWWYADGWQQCLAGIRERVAGTLDYFSIDLLAKTFFAPYRQISAGSVRGPLDVQIRAFFDQLISRFIGAAVRLIMIFIGSIVILLNICIGGVVLLFWSLMPLLPAIGLALFLMGWLPWNN